MKRCLLLMFSALFSAQICAFNWSDLWSTPDQQGQKLMNKSQFAKAKERFQRNDWLGAAAYKSGNYQEAAQLFGGLKTEQGYYNQGNALARMHKYEEAIKAYDKAIDLNAKNQDAVFNRKLVEELLEKDKDNKKQQDKEQQGKEKQDKEQQDKEQQDKKQQDKEQQGKKQQDKEKQDKEKQDKGQQDKGQQDKEQQDKEQQDKEQQDKEQQDKEQQNKEQKKEQSKLGKKQDESQTEMDKETQESKEQWLRLIPDDPGGLMREKFLRDHLRRERGWEQ